MGGRGSKSYSAHHALGASGKLPYNVASFDSVRSGAVYPFLEKAERAWHLLTRPVEDEGDYLEGHTFGRNAPTLRWVNGKASTICLSMAWTRNNSCKQRDLNSICTKVGLCCRNGYLG